MEAIKNKKKYQLMLHTYYDYWCDCYDHIDEFKQSLRTHTNVDSLIYSYIAQYNFWNSELYVDWTKMDLLYANKRVLISKEIDSIYTEWKHDEWIFIDSVYEGSDIIEFNEGGYEHIGRLNSFRIYKDKVILYFDEVTLKLSHKETKDLCIIDNINDPVEIEYLKNCPEDVYLNDLDGYIFITKKSANQLSSYLKKQLIRINKIYKKHKLPQIQFIKNKPSKKR